MWIMLFYEIQCWSVGGFKLKKLIEQWVCLVIISVISSFKIVLCKETSKITSGFVGRSFNWHSKTKHWCVLSYTCRVKQGIKQASFHFLIYYSQDDLRLSCGLVLILCQCKPAKDYVHSCTVQIIPSKWTLQDCSNVCRATCTRKAPGGRFWTLFLGFWRHAQINWLWIGLAGKPACFASTLFWMLQHVG